MATLAHENEIFKKAVSDYEFQMNQMRLYSDATKDMNKQLLNSFVIKKDGAVNSNNNSSNSMR